MDINFEGTLFNPPQSPMGLLRSGGIISLYLLFFFSSAIKSEKES